MSNDTSITFRLPVNLKATLEHLAWLKRETVGKVLRDAAEEYLSRQGQPDQGGEVEQQQAKR